MEEIFSRDESAYSMFCFLIPNSWKEQIVNSLKLLNRTKLIKQ